MSEPCLASFRSVSSRASLSRFPKYRRRSAGRARPRWPGARPCRALSAFFGAEHHENLGPAAFADVAAPVCRRRARSRTRNPRPDAAAVLAVVGDLRRVWTFPAPRRGREVRTGWKPAGEDRASIAAPPWPTLTFGRRRRMAAQRIGRGLDQRRPAPVAERSDAPAVSAT